ncbi:MAG: aldo/keto reductase [Candidatus Latescibacterota bacterium]
MLYRTIGNTGIQTSEVGLGTWAFASGAYGSVAETDAINTIKLALDSGITLFDTAPLYGNAERDGISEEILGKGLGKDRHKILISTKFGRNSTQRANPNFHAQRAYESVDASLKRLNTDHIDVLFFHSPFSDEDIHDDVWEALDKLKEQGKIRLVGHSISKFEDTQHMARNWAKERKIDVIQVVYSLMNRESTTLIHDLGTQGIGIFARESLANGFLSGTITRNTQFESNNLNKRYSSEEIGERVDYVEALSFLIRNDVKTMPQAALRWVLDNPSVSLVLSGAKNPQELQDAIAASASSPFTENEHHQTQKLHTKDFQAA